jgi:hypothetical protein
MEYVVEEKKRRLTAHVYGASQVRFDRMRVELG